MYIRRVQSISRGQPRRDVLWTVSELGKACVSRGLTHRPDIEAIVAPGLFEECAAGIEAVAAGGTEQLHDVAGWRLLFALRILLNCHSHPKCEVRIRSLATALEFCVEHDIECNVECFGTTASVAASIGEPASATAQRGENPVRLLRISCVSPCSLCGVRPG